MRRALVTHKDLLEAIRRKQGSDDFSMVARVILERNGDLTVITGQ